MREKKFLIEKKNLFLLENFGLDPEFVESNV